MSATATPKPNLVQIHSRGGGLLGKCVKCNKILFIYLYPLFGELTYRSDQSADFRAWWLKRRGLAQGGAIRLYCCPFNSLNSHKTPILGAWIGIFKPNVHAKNSNFNIFETTASIATKVCTVIKTTKYPSQVVQYAPNKCKMADGRHLEKMKNGNNSAVDWRILTKFGMSMHLTPLGPVR